MLSIRTILSLSQFLSIQDQDFLSVLLDKYDMNGWSVNITSEVLTDLSYALKSATAGQLISLLNEIATTFGDLRSRINPKYRYDERFKDLQNNLMLDGYSIDNNVLKTLDPSVVGVSSLNDELTEELSTSGLPSSEEVINKLEDSAKAFLNASTNFNPCMNDARIAIQTLASSIAKTRNIHNGDFDEAKWGSVIAYLRKADFITSEEERGLIGVYGFISPGSHRPLGPSEQEYARLGRNFILGMCWFLVKRYNSI